MNLLMRRRELINLKESEKPNLAIDTDFTTPFDHLPRRKITAALGLTKMKRGKKYHLQFDITFNITDYNETTYSVMMLGGYGPWNYGPALGKFSDVDHVGLYNHKTDYTGIFDSNDSGSWCHIDCGGMKGTVRLYNIVITEA